MKLRYQTRALRQIDEALGYIAVRSPQGAANVAARLETIANVIQQQPKIGAKTRILSVRRAFFSQPYIMLMAARLCSVAGADWQRRRSSK